MTSAVPGTNRNLFEKADLWEEAWKTERKGSLFDLQRPELSGREYWDFRASRFARRTSHGRGKGRVADFLHWLERLPGVDRNSEILDIGCGPGAFALEMSSRVKRVVALDPSGVMLGLLQESLERKKILNVEPVQAYWDQIDLAERGWEKRFDLVLASMSPAISDSAALMKMKNASRRLCYYTGIIDRVEPARRELWQEVMGRPEPAYPRDGLYIFHLLYAWGCYPSIELQRREVSGPETVEEMCREMEEFFFPFMKIDRQLSVLIRNYFTARSSNGIFFRNRQEVTARVTWRVD